MAEQTRVSRAGPPLQLFESLINGALRLDPEFLEALEPLEEKIIAVELGGLEQTIYVSLGVNGAVFYPRDEAEEILGSRAADIRLRGSPAALLRMAAAMRRGDPGVGDDVRLSGDLALLETLRDALRRLDIDWEDLLSRYLGDVTAHEVGRAARAFFAWGDHMRRTLLADGGEFLVEELKISPPRYQLEDFAAEVDRLRDDVDRLEKRVARLGAAREPSS